MKNLSSKRRVLIVGEGRQTEYNYFVGFRNAHLKELAATATSVKVERGKGGDARGIVRNAINQARKFRPNSKLGDQVFLLLDTEGAGRAPELPNAEKIAAQYGINIVYSCASFEYWLLCHFSNISRGHFANGAAVIDALDKEWVQVCKSQYSKIDLDIFDRLKLLLPTARRQALEIDLHHLKSIEVARRTNPSTQVYELIAILIGVQTGDRCPISGDWAIVENANIRQPFNKGDTMPTQGNVAVRWNLHHP